MDFIVKILVLMAGVPLILVLVKKKILHILALCLRCFSISILFVCYLAASYYPIPTSYNPLLVYLLACES